jgi:DNA-binding HxlR family transcriptional regulator
MAPRIRFDLPSKDEDTRLAHGLLGRVNRLDLEILRLLVGRPRRYSELRPLLRGRNDHNLTMSLDRLRRDGLVRRRSDVSHDPPIDVYELTSLGILVYDRTVQFELASALGRGAAARRSSAPA